MEKCLAICGIDCSICDARIATLNNDDNLRRELARKWVEEYNSPDIKPEDINCVGCTDEGVHIGYCGECAIRKCGMEKGVINCAYCDDYACETLTSFFEMAPNIKANLDEQRAKLS